MTKSASVHLFPAFVQKYTGAEVKILNDHNINFENILTEAQHIVNSNITEFDIKENNFMDNELKNQYITYIISCGVSKLLKQKNQYPDYVAGISMGIYSALYDINAISFNDGLQLIINAYEICRKVIPSKSEFGMGYIVGLNKEEIQNNISENNLCVEIVNTNNIHSTLLSGKKGDIIRIIKIAKNEGAIQTGVINTSIPYHSKYLKETENYFSTFVDKLRINKPRYPIVSSIDQQILLNPEQIRHELVRNLKTPLNWHNTMKKLNSLEIKYCIECGPGDSLYRIGKFIDKDFTIIPVNKLNTILAQ